MRLRKDRRAHRMKPLAGLIGISSSLSSSLSNPSATRNAYTISFFNFLTNLIGMTTSPLCAFILPVFFTVPPLAKLGGGSGGGGCRGPVFTVAGGRSRRCSGARGPPLLCMGGAFDLSDILYILIQQKYNFMLNMRESVVIDSPPCHSCILRFAKHSIVYPLQPPCRNPSQPTYLS